MPGVLMLRYEDMMREPFLVASRIEEFLGISVDSRVKKELLWQYSRENPAGERGGMHFNKAESFGSSVEFVGELWLG